MFSFCARQSFRERVGSHVVRRAVDESNGLVFDDVADEVVMNVDVFRACMKISVCGDGNSRLVVTVESGWICEW